MAKIRRYDFVVGPETNTALTAGTPSDASDLVTLTYLQTYADGVRGTTTLDGSTQGSDVALAAITTANLVVAHASLASIATIVAPSATRAFMLINKTGATVQIKNETGGTAANRIVTGTGAALNLSNDASLLLTYNTNNSRWHVVGGTGGGSSAGGSHVEWNADGYDAPVLATEFNNKVYVFTDGGSQNLYCSVKVPESYTPGSQIKMYVSHYHQAASATQLLRAQSTLIPHGTAFDNTTNQRTTTNSAQSGASKELIKATLDLTDGTGNINAVAVAAGDIIRVKLYRDSDTSTSDISMIPSATEVKFT